MGIFAILTFEILMKHLLTSSLALNNWALIYSQNPDQLLELYNSVIQHLSDTLTSDSLLTVSWPVPEFTKNEELGKYKLKVLNVS